MSVFSSKLISIDRIPMAEEASDTELGEYSVEVSHEKVENFGYAHEGNGEVSYYTVASDSDCLELMVDGVELSSTAGIQCEDVSKDEITILTADGHFISDRVGQLIHCDVDGTDAVNGQPLVLNLAHPMGMRIALIWILLYRQQLHMFSLLARGCTYYAQQQWGHWGCSFLFDISFLHTYAVNWLGGSVVERQSLTGELSLVCTRPAADG